MKPILFLYFNFIVYSFLGWIAQGIFVGYKKGHFVNTGFLYGPYVPIYGFGCLIILYVVDPFFHNWLTIFLATMILCSALEYFTSWAMQKLFHRLWWNYTGQPFNLNGRICLLNSTLYGIAGVFVTYVSQPVVIRLRDLFSTQGLLIFEILFSIVFFTDLICTLIHLYKTRKSVETIHVHMQQLKPEEVAVHPQVASSLQVLAGDRHVKAFPHALLDEPYKSSVEKAHRLTSSK